nr:unnamed protein product [Spirometra erinaceieuropaei]
MWPCIFLTLFFLVLPVFSCDPEVKYRDYTSKEALLSSKTVILLEGRATCTHDELNELYAVLGDTVVPVSRNLETDEFHVTFSDEHKKLPKGYYTVRFYDDEGYLSVRKAQSLGQPIQSIKPVFSVEVYHGGVWLRPWIHSETVALLTAALVGLGAVLTKKKMF